MQHLQTRQFVTDTVMKSPTLPPLQMFLAFGFQVKVGTGTKKCTSHTAEEQKYYFMSYESILGDPLCFINTVPVRKPFGTLLYNDTDHETPSLNQPE